MYGHSASVRCHRSLHCMLYIFADLSAVSANTEEEALKQLLNILKAFLHSPLQADAHSALNSPSTGPAKAASL